MATSTRKQQKDADKEAAEKDAPVTGKATTAATSLREEGDERGNDAMSTPDSAVNPITQEPHQPEPRTVTIKIEDAKLDVDVEGFDGDEDEPKSISDLNEKDLQDLQRRVLEESANRGHTEDRPFKDLDTESLLVLSHAVRAEVASR